MSLSTDEHIAKIDARMEQLKAQKQALLKRKNEKERKARTRRLIQNGALAEQYLQCEGMGPEEFEELLRLIVAIPGFGSIVPHQTKETE